MTVAAAAAAAGPAMWVEGSASLAAWLDEPGLVGEHDGLDAVAEAELGQYPPDMDLDGSLGQVHLAGDLAVGEPGGEPGEDGAFPVGELAEQGIPVGLLAGGREQGDELVDEPPGRGGGEDRLTAGHGADGGEQFGRRGVLEEESAGAGLEPGEDVLVQVEGGEDQDLAGRGGGGDRGGRLDSVHAGHPDI